MVDYTITITNTGQTPYDGASRHRPADRRHRRRRGLQQRRRHHHRLASATPAPDLTWTGDLAPGQAATITFTVTVDNPDTGDQTITSTLTSAAPGSTCPPSGPAPACTSTVTVLIPALTITKTASTTTTTPGSTVGYTITVTDTGPTPYTAATVTDSLDGVLDDATYNSDATATTGTPSVATPAPT